MSKQRKVSEAIKKSVAGRQFYKCANSPNSRLDKLENYLCPLWTNPNKTIRGNFDECGYDNIGNLQALCKSCHLVKTKAFLRVARKKKKDSVRDDTDSADEFVIDSDEDEESIDLASDDKNDSPNVEEIEVRNKIKISDYQCTICLKQFARKENLQYHTSNNVCETKQQKDSKIIQKDGNNGPACNFCGKKFTVATSMYRHMNHSCRIKKRDDEKALIYDRLFKLEADTRDVKEENKQIKKEINMIKSYI